MSYAKLGPGRTAQTPVHQHVFKIDVAVDGSSRGNPGPGGIGIAIYDECARMLYEASHFIGDGITSPQAEYMALIKGLEKACSICLNDVTVLSDSQLVIKQMRKEWRIHNLKLRELNERARILELLFKRIRYVKVLSSDPRLKTADKLAKIGSNGRSYERDVLKNTCERK